MLKKQLVYSRPVDPHSFSLLDPEKLREKKKLKKFKEIDNNCNFNYFIKNVKVNLDQLFVFYYRYF